MGRIPPEQADAAQRNSNTFDVIVIGGGPAGLMAAIAAQQVGARTLLIEKGNRLGRKLGISGGGRCNVTNAKPLPELMQNIPGNGRFLFSALHRFSNEDVRRFFEELGIRLKEEDRGRVFPINDKAATVVKALVNKVFEVGVEVWEDTPVDSLVHSEGRIEGVNLRRGDKVQATAVVIATGGASVPKTGSTGDAYPWAQSVGHTLIPPYPTEVPLTSDDWFIRERAVQGLSLQNVDMSIFDGRGKRLTTEHGDMIFTHLGLSGPAALRCSHYVSTALQTDPTALLKAEIDFQPATSRQAWLETLEQRRKADGRKQIHNVVTDWLPNRLADVLLRQCNIDGSIQMANLRNDEVLLMTTYLKAFPVAVTGTLPLHLATVTGGGVSVKEIDPKTMASKRCVGLYFAGEVMDVHAHTGGYNITVAFSTGHCAGTSAAQHARTF